MTLVVQEEPFICFLSVPATKWYYGGNLKETIREIIISDNQPGGQILSWNRVSFDGFVQVFIAVSCVSVVSFRWFRSVVSVVLVVSFHHAGPA